MVVQQSNEPLLLTASGRLAGTATVAACGWGLQVPRWATVPKKRKARQSTLFERGSKGVDQNTRKIRFYTNRNTMVPVKWWHIFDPFCLVHSSLIVCQSLLILTYFFFIESSRFEFMALSFASFWLALLRVVCFVCCFFPFRFRAAAIPSPFDSRQQKWQPTPYGHSDTLAEATTETEGRTIAAAEGGRLSDSLGQISPCGARTPSHSDGCLVATARMLAVTSLTHPLVCSLSCSIAAHAPLLLRLSPFTATPMPMPPAASLPPRRSATLRLRLPVQVRRLQAEFPPPRRRCTQLRGRLVARKD